MSATDAQDRSEMISFRLPAWLLRELARLADDHDRTLSGEVRYGLRAYVETERRRDTAEDAA